MSKMERKEFQETKIMRTVSPVRNQSGSSQNLAEFDSNLDYLLEDLQNSVSRPGSALGQTSSYSREARTNSLNRTANFKSSNPNTEYSSDDAYTYTSPDGRKHVSSYKKESYSYKTSGDLPPERARMQNSINQLDSLLDDLQQVKKSSYLEKDSYNIGSDPGYQRRRVNRELHFGDTPKYSSRSQTMERSERTEHDGYASEGTYGDLRTLNASSPSSRTSTLTKQTRVKNLQTYPVEVVETVLPEDIDPEVLASLDPNLRPPGNTKVTTTIKTYTYEIPGSGDYPTNLQKNTSVDEKYIYSPNQTITTPSKSFVYNKIENQSSENKYYRSEPTTYSSTKIYDKSSVNEYQPYQKPPPPVNTSILKETVTTRNYQPGYTPAIPPSQQTYVYNETTTTKNVNDYPPPQTRHDTYIHKETHNTTERYPPISPPRNETYIYKETNTTNTVNHPYPNGYPPSEKVIYKHETHSTNEFGPGSKPGSGPGYGRKPNEPVNIQYKYTSTNTNVNNYKGGYPDDDDEIVPKFPTDNEIVDSGPPKRVEDLMATIGKEPANSPLNAGFTQHEQELITQKKVETLKRQQEEADEQKKEPVVKTKNITGPAVYYPPGEMFKKEEGGGAWRAEGGYGKASGKYEYEASSKSKSKSSSGATVVPVCLPLCCGLPCALL